MTPIQTILHATDFSDAAEHAFHLACSLARDHDARLVIVHVAPPPYPVVGEVLTIPPVPVEADENRHLQQRLRLEQVKPSIAGIPVEYRLEEGEPVARILAVADDVGAGLIVLGTHGRTGLSRLLMGSVAESVVRRANCSVLTVKTPRPHRMEEASAHETELAHAH